MPNLLFVFSCRTLSSFHINALNLKKSGQQSESLRGAGEPSALGGKHKYQGVLSDTFNTLGKQLQASDFAESLILD